MEARGGGKVLWALIAIVLALWAPATAPAEGEEDTGGFGAFRLKGTNGYSVLVLASSKPHFKHGEVIVFVRGRNSGVTYLAPATVTATTIDADLGAVGRISVAFEPEGQTERVHPSCDVDGTIEMQPGSWVGSIELTGEEGFTHVEAKRAKSTVSPFVELVCGGVGIGESGGPGARFVARSATKKQSVFLQVNQNRPSGPVRVEASLQERRGTLFVSRDLVHRFPGGAFSFHPQLKSAVLAPPAPFSGSATFHRDARPKNRWTGSLTLDFPGHANVSMSGSRFKVALWHAKRTEMSD